MRKVYADSAVFLNAADPPDIAIFHLVQKLSFNSLVKSIRLPSRSQENESFNNQRAVSIGWGGVSSGLPRFLQYGSFRVRNDCGFREWQICTKGEGLTDLRGGDSGGPLFIVENGEPTLIGVNVFIVNGLVGSTRVSKFLQFINDVTGIPIR